MQDVWGKKVKIADSSRFYASKDPNCKETMDRHVCHQFAWPWVLVSVMVLVSDTHFVVVFTN